MISDIFLNNKRTAGLADIPQISQEVFDLNIFFQIIFLRFSMLESSFLFLQKQNNHALFANLASENLKKTS